MTPDEAANDSSPGYIYKEFGTPKWKDLTIHRTPHGGYTVWEPALTHSSIDFHLFACSTLDEALAFVRDNIMENAKVQPKRWQLAGPNDDTLAAMLEPLPLSSQIISRLRELAKKRGRRIKPTRARKVK